MVSPPLPLPYTRAQIEILLEDNSRPSTPVPASAPAKEAAPAPTRGGQKGRGGPAARGGRYYGRGGKSGPRDKENAEVTGEDPPTEPRKPCE